MHGQGIIAVCLHMGKLELENPILWLVMELIKVKLVMNNQYYKGIVPIACSEIFNRIEAKTIENNAITYEVCLSMSEIYMEKV